MQTSEKKAEALLSEILLLVKERHPRFSRSSLTLDDHFEKDLGLDSLARVELISRIESHFGSHFSQRLINEAQTPKELLRELLGDKAKPFFTSLTKKSTRELQETSGLPGSAQTLLEVLEWHVKHHPKRPHIQFYEDEREGETISYAQLKEKSLQVAAGLQKLSLKPAQAVAIMLPTSADYFYSFFGIVLAGGVPVPIYPPSRPSQLEEHLQRHTKILQNCEAAILITFDEAEQVGRLLKSYAYAIENIVTVEQLCTSDTPQALPKLNSDDTAFIQYTSGSTGDPKGVVLTHANLISNIRAMGKAVDASSKDVFVSWLPLYHDMGLIGAWLGSLYHASLFVVLSPLSFLSRPERWLWAIHRYEGTLTASPNFGYEYCLHRLKRSDLDGLDLSSCRGAFNGAEPVSHVTIKNFSAHFKDYGFDETAMTPVYGLAESTVGLTFSSTQRPPLIDTIRREHFMKNAIAEPAIEGEKDLLHFVSCGLPLAGHQIRIVDDAGHELPQRQEGLLQFSGPSSTQGYFKNPKKNRELFEQKWLNTGDRAYIAKGELYLTGRTKDIIIRAGRNIYPDELEKEIGAIEGIRKGCVAVFGLFDEASATQKLVILAESKVKESRGRKELHKEINELATELIGGPPDEIVLAEQGAVLKTSSGKIRRSATRDLFAEKGGKASSQNLAWQLMRLSLKSLWPRLWRIVRLVQSHLFAIYSWTLFCLICAVSWLGIVLLPTLSLRWSMVRFCAALLGFLSFTRLTVQGRENLPKTPEGLVIVANHSSYIDALVLVAVLPSPAAFIVKSELKTSFWTRLPLQKMQARFVERFDIGKSIEDSQALTEDLHNKKALLFFPEGTFTRIPGLRPFHLGAFSAAAQADVPLLSIAIAGTRAILPSDSWFPRHGSIHVEIGERLILTAEEKTLDIWHKALLFSQKSRDFMLKHIQEPDLMYEAD
jgi:1-acyl-sn-glycerol-3-phosphate acyltransferase